MRGCMHSSLRLSFKWRACHGEYVARAPCPGKLAQMRVSARIHEPRRRAIRNRPLSAEPTADKMPARVRGALRRELSPERERARLAVLQLHQEPPSQNE